MVKRVYAVERNCIACRLCEVACITEHSASKDIIVAMRYERPRPKARIRVLEAAPDSFAFQCRHCSEPLCVYSCLTQALKIEGEGEVVYEADYCIGCWTCILACPYGAIARDVGEGKAIAKCDLCPEREVPACVAICPNEALVYGEEAEWQAEYVQTGRLWGAHSSPRTMEAQGIEMLAVKL